MAATDATEVVNGALALLGEDPISDIEDTTNGNAIKMNALYQGTYEYCLVAHDWGCATTWGTCAALGDTPPPGFDSVWQLPGTPRLLKIQILRLQDIDRALPYQRLFQQKVAVKLDPSETLWCRYSFDPTELELESHVLNYVEHRLAWRACMAITGKTDLTALMKKQHDDTFTDSKRIEAHSRGGSKKVDLTRLTRRKGGPNWPEGTDQG